jgi:hypothetical protein
VRQASIGDVSKERPGRLPRTSAFLRVGNQALGFDPWAGVGRGADLGIFDEPSF